MAVRTNSGTTLEMKANHHHVSLSVCLRVNASLYFQNVNDAVASPEQSNNIFL